MMTRREFLKRMGVTCFGLGLSSSIIDLLSKSEARAAKNEKAFLHEALFYKKIDKTTVQCELCHRGCTLSDGYRSFCRAREPKEGKLYSLVYGQSCAVHIDPIEKKPLYHFLPGTPVFSIATAGCNFRCKYCQNWQISQSPPEETENIRLSPQNLIDQTAKSNCPTIAYTYTEPSIFYEYMLDTAKAAKTAGIRNIYHSNGSLNPKPVEELSYYLDAANIDLKGFTQDFYTEVCAGYLDTVLNTLKTLKRNKVWVEITNLVIPTLNDDMKKIQEMSAWIKDNLGEDTPLHFSRFWPQYKLTNLSPTSVETLENAKRTAEEAGLKYVYVGNVPGHPSEDTYCANCKEPLIKRSGYIVLGNNVAGGKCKFCGALISGVWS